MESAVARALDSKRAVSAAALGQHAAVNQTVEDMCGLVLKRKGYFDRPNLQACATSERHAGMYWRRGNSTPAMMHGGTDSFRLLVVTTISDAPPLLAYLKARSRTRGNDTDPSVPCNVSLLGGAGARVNDCVSQSHSELACLVRKMAATRVVESFEAACGDRREGARPWFEREYGADIDLYRAVRAERFLVVKR